MFRAAFFSLPLAGGLVRARPDGLRGRSYSNPNTCACPDGSAPTGDSSGYLPVSTIRETVTECITVTESAATVYETVIQDHGYGSGGITRTGGPEIVTITRTVIVDDGQSASDKERTRSATNLERTVTVTYHDGVTRTRGSYETQPPNGYNDNKYPDHGDGQTGSYDAPGASITGGGQGYEGNRDYPGAGHGYDDKKDDAGQDHGGDQDYDHASPDYHNGGKKGNGGSKDNGGEGYGNSNDNGGKPSPGGHGYDQSTSDYSDGGDKSPENYPSGDGSRGYLNNGNGNGNGNNGGSSGGYAPQHEDCYDPHQPGRPCVTTIIIGTSTRYHTVYPSTTLSAKASGVSACTLTTKLVTEYETVLSTVRHTSSTSVKDTYETSTTDVYETGAAGGYETGAADPYVTASPDTYDSVMSDGYDIPATNSTRTTSSGGTGAQQTNAYLPYNKREPRERLHNLAYQW